MSNNEISFNGVAGYSSDWEAGGSKSWQTTKQTVTHNFVHDNRGPGLWADGGNMTPLRVQQDHRELGSRYPARDQL